MATAMSKMPIAGGGKIIGIIETTIAMKAKTNTADPGIGIIHPVEKRRAMRLAARVSGRQLEARNVRRS